MHEVNKQGHNNNRHYDSSIKLQHKRSDIVKILPEMPVDQITTGYVGFLPTKNRHSASSHRTTRGIREKAQQAHARSPTTAGASERGTALDHIAIPANLHRGTAGQREIKLTSHIIEAQQASERQERIGAHAHTKAHGPHREAHMQLIRRRHASRRGTGHTQRERGTQATHTETSGQL